MDRWNKRKKPLRGRNFDSQHLKTLNNESSNSQEDTGPQVELENLWVLWPWRGGVNFTFVRFFFSPFVKKAFLLWFNFNFNFENPDPAGNVINRLEKEICLRPVTPRNLAKRARNFPAQRGRWSFPPFNPFRGLVRQEWRGACCHFGRLEGARWVSPGNIGRAPSDKGKKKGERNEKSKSREEGRRRAGYEGQ